MFILLSEMQIFKLSHQQAGVSHTVPFLTHLFSPQSWAVKAAELWVLPRIVQTFICISHELSKLRLETFLVEYLCSVEWSCVSWTADVCGACLLCCRLVLCLPQSILMELLTCHIVLAGCREGMSLPFKGQWLPDRE